MCEFLSWIKKGEKVYFLTKELIESERGKTVLRDSKEDITGHGAIRLFFGLEQDEGKNKECVDFSTPANFPESIVKAIKATEFNCFPLPRGLLLKSLDDKYWADRNPLDDKYRADLKSLDDKYWADRNPIEDKYQADRKPIEDKYRADRKSLDDKYQADRKPIEDKYRADLKPLEDKYQADRKPIDDKYRADRKSLDDKYWDLFADPKNRSSKWV